MLDVFSNSEYLRLIEEFLPGLVKFSFDDSTIVN